MEVPKTLTGTVTTDDLSGETFNAHNCPGTKMSIRLLKEHFENKKVRISVSGNWGVNTGHIFLNDTINPINRLLGYKSSTNMMEAELGDQINFTFEREY